MTRLELLDRVAWDGRSVPGERTHALLRALAEAGPRGLSEDALVEEVWGGDTPANPGKALQVVVSRARSATCPEAIERTARGYRLALGVEDVDVWALRPAGLRLAAEGRYAEALPLLEQEARREAIPDDEVVGALLRAVAAVQGVPAALERFETYRTGIADALGVDPSPTLRALHQELLARDRPVRSGLVYDATSLIGREPDIAAVSALLRTSRVVTILGPGGLGKTRLAQVLARTAEQPVVHFVELVGVTSPDDVIGEVGSALGVRDSVSGRRVLTPEQRADVRARIAQQLEQVPALLVLDNCEHIVEAVADLTAFLVAAVRDLRVLTTSRAPLAIGAERVYALGQLDRQDAMELFRRRATAARPGVALPDDTVAEVVSRLDGLPLAIELAAVKIRVMSVEDVAHRLSNRFALLRGGDRSAPDRHQTLLAVIDWSWNLLGERERRALRQLSVFHDGFTLDAAESMLGPEALDALQELVDQSLLTVVDAGASARYRMLETVREFGRMQLVDAGEEGAARAAQRAWATAYADQHADRIFSVDQPAAMDAIRAEESNLADVLRQALGDADPAAAVRLYVALAAFWSISGDHARVVVLVRALTEVLGDWTPPDELLERTRLALALAMFNGTITGAPEAAVLRDRLETLGATSANPPLRALIAVLMTVADPAGGDARARIDALLEDPDRRVRALGYQFVSHERENSGDPEAAMQAATRALELATDEDGPWTTAMLHTQLSGLHAQFGEVEQAAGLARRALPVLERLGAVDDALQLKAVLAVAALDRGRVEEAERLVDEIATMSPRGGFGTIGTMLSTRGQIALARGEVRAGLDLLRAALDETRQVRFPSMRDADLAPWVVYAEAMVLTTYARYGEGDDGADLYAEILRKAPAALEPQRLFLDYPVAGVALFAIGLWGLLRETLPPKEAVRLLVIADRFAYNRFSPTMRWEKAVEDAERLAPGVLDDLEKEYGDRRGPALLDEARDVVGHIFRL